MKVKLKLRLKSGEVVALSKHLATTLGSQQVEELRKEPADMLIMSALYEIYSKVKEQSENIRLFGNRRTDELYAVTLTRTQALALCCVVVDEPKAATAMQTYEANFLQGLLGTIHQTFLV
ncbi:hypothetical protein [Spirosoma areae]